VKFISLHRKIAENKAIRSCL